MYSFNVVEVLSVDKQLANEIEFDLRKFDEQQKEMEEQQKRKKEETLQVLVKKCGQNKSTYKTQ